MNKLLSDDKLFFQRNQFGFGPLKYMLQDLRSMGTKNTLALRIVTFQLSKETFSAIDSMYVLVISRLLDLSQLTFSLEITALAYNVQYEFMSWDSWEVDLAVRNLLQSEKVLEKVATLK